MGVYTEAVQKLYVAYFSRPADAAGLTYWEGIVTANGGNTAAVSTAFANSQEYKDTFAGQSQYQIINTIYMNLFGRPAEAEGLTYWGQGLINGTFTVAEAVTTIAGAAQGTDATAYANKVAAATAFTAALDTSAEILGYDGTAANLAAKTWLAGVTDVATSLSNAIVPATLNTAIAGVISTGSASTGQNFTLTNAIGEQSIGTVGNDVFSAVIGNNGGTDVGTFNTGDTINGMGGQDTLNLLVTAGSTMPAGATVSNVEIVNITHAGASGALALNSSTFSGVQQLWQVANAAGSAFQNVTVGSGVTAGFRSTGTSTTDVAATATVTVAAGVTSTAVALDGVATSSSITFAGAGAADALSTISVSGSVVTEGTGASAVNALTLTAGATTNDVDVLNLSLSSNTNVTLTGFDDLTTFNASGSTGNLTVNLGTPDELTTATFGSGKDTVTLNTANLEGDALAINLGAGNDVLNLAANASAEATNVTITLGAGNDTLAVTALSNLSGTSASAIDASIITVADFVAAQDVLDLSALGSRETLVNTELGNISDATTFAAALALVDSYTEEGSFAVFNYGSDAYIYANNAAADGADANGLIKIVGLSVASLNDTNFVVGAASAGN